MRRSERRIKDQEIINQILGETEFGVLSLCDGEEPYGLPLHYVHDAEEGSLYFHCALKGRKIDIVQRNDRAHFLVARSLGLYLFDGGETCQSTAGYESVMLAGRLSTVDGTERKWEALEKLMKKYMPDGKFEFSEGMLKVTCVLKLTIEDCSAKANKRG